MFAKRSRARWMGPAMVVAAGIAGGAPAGADGRASDDAVEIPAWQAPFVRNGVAGGVVVRRLGTRRTFASDLDDAGRGRLPDATFRPTSLLIALETGTVRDMEQVYAWDGVARPVAAWNADHTVRSAMRLSAVPVLQRLARDVGEPHMGSWLARLGYGNADVSGGIDRFWFDGGLRVTALQQVDFVDRLLRGTLPASGRAQAMARDSVPAAASDRGAVIHASSGLARATTGGAPDVGWWVGWVEGSGGTWAFASVAEGSPERVRRASREAAKAALEGIAATPGTADPKWFRTTSVHPIPAMFRG